MSSERPEEPLAGPANLSGFMSRKEAQGAIRLVPWGRSFRVRTRALRLVARPGRRGPSARSTTSSMFNVVLAQPHLLWRMQAQHLHVHVGRDVIRRQA